MSHEHVMKKIPGDIPPPSKKEGQGYIHDLSQKRIFELKELLERQDHLLANKRFVSKLPDKGEKIRNFRAKVSKELEHRSQVEEAAKLLSRLNIASEGKDAMNELEWTGKYSEKTAAEKVVQLDSDDEDDPLKILAQPTGSGVHKKKVIHLPPEESLIKPTDLEDIRSFQTTNTVEEEHIKYIVDMVEGPKDATNKTQKRVSFKPYKSTKSNVHDPAKEKERKRDKHWEVTAATPPPSVHGAVKALTIHESLILQTQQVKAEQELRTKHAAERLAEQLGMHSLGPTPAHGSKYRSMIEEDETSSSEDEEEHEVHDDDDLDKAGTVVFTVDTVET